MRRSSLKKSVFGFLSGAGMRYEKKAKCKDLQCPPQSTCFDLYPARCRAETGFVVLPGGTVEVGNSFNDSLFTLVISNSSLFIIALKSIICFYALKQEGS